MTKEEFYQMMENSTSDYRVLMFKANVSNVRDHWSCFKIPPDFLHRRFRLQY